MRKRCVLFILCFIVYAAGAQQRYSISHFTNRDGLPANSIKGMEWDARTSLLWIGTEGGIVRWDGSNFEISGSKASRVLQMGSTEGNHSPFYAVCDNDSVYLIEQGRVRTWYRHRDELAFRQLHLPDSAEIFAPIRKGPGTIIWPAWLLPVSASLDTVLIFFNRNVYLREGRQVRKLLGAVGGAQLLRMRGHALVYTEKGLLHYDPQRRELRPTGIAGFRTPEDHFIRNDGERPPMLLRNGTLYRLAAGAGDRWRLDPVCTRLPAGIQPQFVRELPHQGIIVLADAINGIYMLRQQFIRQLTDTTGTIPSSQLVTYGQALLPDGRILSHSGVVYDRSGPMPGKNLPVGSSPNLVRFRQHLYFAPLGNLFRFHLGTGTSEQFATPFENGDWSTMVEMRKELYFIAHSLVARLSGNELREVYRFPESPGVPLLPNNTAIEWSAGTLLIGSGNYVRFLDVDRKTLRSVKVSETAPVRNLWRTGQGVFICTYGDGLFLLRNDSCYRLPWDKSGHLRFAHAIVPDGQGACYISTNNGIFKVSEKALYASALTGAPVYYHYLGKEDGLEQTELNGGGQPAYLQLPDKTLSFPSINGLVQFHPDSLRIGPPPGVILVSATVDGRPIDSFPARLGSDAKLFQFDVTVPFWGARENLYAWYRLRRKGEPDGASRWIPFDPARQRAFTFTALKADRYAFEVRTFKGFTSGDFSVRSFPFDVAPPWYATLPFLVLWVLLGFALSWLLFYVRTRQLRARSAQLETTVAQRTREIELQKQQLGQQLKLVSEAHDLKERLIAVISHNIITPLRYIHRATTMMRDDARSLDPALREKAVDSINDTSLELELLSVNLLNWIRLQHQQVQAVPEAFTFSEIAAHVQGLLGAVARSKGQAIVLQGDGSISLYQLKDALQVILYNLVLNAITHSGGTTCTLECRKEGTQVLVSVADDGRGMPEGMKRKLAGDPAAQGTLKETDNQGKGFGFIIIRDLVRFIGGSLHLEPANPGTRITIVFGNQPSPSGKHPS
ncbi:ATP-binding protein [Flaviaesturariibacter amylovorans]|uniref:Histidine kinase domain-containing protein n=1 Tax=Flaviaesturariibacter amylovorans TaxID=1084520 RepID=A0ABP8GF46_9BACT